MKKNRCALAYANAPLGTQWGKRILSTLLAVVLCLGLLPGAAFAAGTYTHADVNTVLDRVVKNETSVGTGDTTYDVDKDGKLTSWDAKKMLDSMPESIKVNAMRLTTFDGDEETPGGTYADWVSLEIKDGKLTTTTINKFTDTILDLFNKESAYPVAGVLNGEKLVVRMSYNGDDSLIQADPDSFVARKLTLQPDEYGLNYSWYDATTLSDERLLSVYQESNSRVRFSLMDGEKVLASSAPDGAPYLKGIAATGKKDGGSEILYGITSGGALYSFTLTVGTDSDDQIILSIGDFEQLGDSDIYKLNGKYLSSTSLLYDTASGYLLVAATYLKNVGDSVGVGVLYLIDPDNPNDYVTVDLPDGVELNSLYQDNRPESEKSTEGVQLYLSENAVSVKAGQSVELPEAKAYSYSTTDKLVTNEKVSVSWESKNKNIAKVENGHIIGVAEGTTTITATATANGQTATETVTVIVNPDTGAKVGVLIEAKDGKADYVWATIDLGIFDADGSTFQAVTSDVELVSEYLAWGSVQEAKTYRPGGGYAQGLLWGNYYIRNSDTPNNHYYTIDSDAPPNESTWITPAHNNSGRIADLTDSPVIDGGISYNNDKTEANALARAVFVNEGGNIAWLTGNGTRDSLASKSSESPYSAIAYVGDLTAAQVKGVSLECDSKSTCHVYYALKKDGTLNQVILVPRVVDLKDEFDHRYSLSETTIGQVTFGTNSAGTTSMDLLKMGDKFGLLVARSDNSAREEKHTIWYIDLTKVTVGEDLSATLKGDLTNTTLTLTEGTAKVSGVSALYHTGNMTLDEADILRIAGWSDVQASQSAPMAAPAISVLSDEDVSVPAEPSDNTITVRISADKAATNGKWTVTYPAGKMELDSVSKDAGIVYYKTNDDENGTVTLAFASRDAIKAGNALFTLTFTGDGSDKDVTVTCDELNKPAGSSSSGGGGGGGSTGTDSAVALPSGVTGGSVSSSTDKAKPGDTVTITVEPDEGYVPGTVKVVDKDGKEIAVKDLGNGKYSFVMPTGKVDVQVTFAPATGGFTDVSADAYYREAVLWAVEKGVTNGVSDTLFGPDQACTRAQIVTFLWRAAGSPEPTAAGGFTDVPADAYYAKAVAWAVENGITTGVAEGLFAPDATCTRAQSVTFLFRALDGTAGTGSSFTDVPADAWYAAAVAWAVEKGVTNGISESQFGPDGDCTRAQIVTFLWRAMK